MITREDEDAQKPSFSKVSSRGWENRTPTKGFGDPYHTIWPIPYKVYYTYFQNYIHVDISLRINFLRCWLSFVLRGVTSWLRLSAFWSSPHPISNSQLHVLPHFHLCPIYLVVFKGSYSLLWGISHLEGGFTLRCLQRLSLPDLATLPCRWPTADTPVVRPSRSSRTKDSSSQISSARAG